MIHHLSEMIVSLIAFQYFTYDYMILISQNENYVSIIRVASKPNSGLAKNKNKYSKVSVPAVSTVPDESVEKQDGDTEEDRELILRFFAMRRRWDTAYGVECHLEPTYIVIRSHSEGIPSLQILHLCSCLPFEKHPCQLYNLHAMLCSHLCLAHVQRN